MNRYGHPMGTIGGSRGPVLSSNRQKGILTELGDNSSEEHIVQKTDYGAYKGDVRAGSTTSDRSSHQDGILVTRTYEIEPSKSTLDV